MCIIAYSPANNEIPSADRRKTMFEHNPDGAGFMFPDGGFVHIEKGFMTFADMEKRLTELSRTYDFTALPIVFHYRIGTHGGNTPQNTHPFPVTSNRHSLKLLTCDTLFAVAHNGIIHCVKPKKGYSDTQEYIFRRLSHIKTPYDSRILSTIAAETGSKFAFMYGDGKVQLVGAIERAGDGNYYSNSSYLGVRDLYTHTYPTWSSLLRRHQGNYEPMDEFIPLDDDIVIDSDGALHDGEDYCMDVFGRIYKYDDYGCPVLTQGTHLLLSGMTRSTSDTDDELDIDWLYSTDKTDSEPWD